MNTESIFSLEGRTTLVAGASRGIGLAIAQAVSRAGARTILASRSFDALEARARELRQQGWQAEAARLDFTDPQSIQALVEACPEIDVLINVAGTNIRKPVEQFTKEEYEFLLRTNLHGIFELTQLAGAKMIARGKGGKIVNIGSLASFLALPYMAVYAVTKSGLAGLTRALAAEWGRHNIQVNCIAPGFIITDLNRKMWEQPEMRKWYQGAAANPRLGLVEDVAPLAVFLSGRGSDYITGQLIAVDGGYSTTAVWPFEP